MSSHYKQIKGIKYSAPLLSAADEMVAGQGDGRISLEDAEKLFAMLGKDGKYSDLEKRSLSYVRDNYTFTEAGDEFLRKQIRSWAAKRGHANAKKSKGQAETTGAKKGRQLAGRVISNKPVGGKTIVVEVERRVLHPKYKKIVKRPLRFVWSRVLARASTQTFKSFSPRHEAFVFLSVFFFRLVLFKSALSFLANNA